MISIYCSKKLELFAKEIISKDYAEIKNHFGNWIGRLIIIKQKKYLLITNEKTAFSVVICEVKKNDLKVINSIISNAIINQVKQDIGLNKQQEFELFSELQQIVFYPTNNNKKIVGTMNEFVSILNYLLAIKYGDNNYFYPKELMFNLFQNYDKTNNIVK